MQRNYFIFYSKWSSHKDVEKIISTMFNIDTYSGGSEILLQKLITQFLTNDPLISDIDIDCLDGCELMVYFTSERQLQFDIRKLQQTYQGSGIEVYQLDSLNYYYWRLTNLNTDEKLMITNQPIFFERLLNEVFPIWDGTLCEGYNGISTKTMEFVITERLEEILYYAQSSECDPNVCFQC